MWDIDVMKFVIDNLTFRSNELRYIEYIPIIVRTICTLSGFVVVWFGSGRFYMWLNPCSFDFRSAGEEILKAMGK